MGWFERIGVLTHPDYATLVDPLFACGGKRGFVDSSFLDDKISF